MTTTYHAPIAVGASNHPDTVNNPLGQLDAAIGSVIGGATVTHARLVEWAASDAYRLGAAPTYSSTYPDVIASCPIVWPDSSSGAYTATVIDSVWEEPTTYALTHTASSKTVTVTGLVRSADGQITTQPTYSVS